MPEMLQQHTDELKQMLGLKPAAKIPKAVTEFYWRVKRYVDRVSAPPMDANILACIIIFSKVTEEEIRAEIKAAEPPPPPEPDEGPVHDEDVGDDILPKIDDGVTTNWKEVLPGRDVVHEDGREGWFLKREHSGLLHIDFAGDEASYRKVDPREMRLVGE